MLYNANFTVVTPASDYSLVDLATVKDELSITDAEQDTRLTRWILEAGAVIQGPAGIARVLRAETLLETYRAQSYQPDTHGEHYYPRNHNAWGLPDVVPGLRLRRDPIVSVTSIVEDDVTLDPALDFEVDGEAALIYRLSGSQRVPWWAQYIAVTYIGGYVTHADVPFDISSAVLTMLKYRLSLHGRDPMLRQISIPGVIERQWSTGMRGDNQVLPPEVETMIGGYRNRRV